MEIAADRRLAGWADGQAKRLTLRAIGAGLLLLSANPPIRLSAQDTATVRIANDSVSVRFVDADLRAVV